MFDWNTKSNTQSRCLEWNSQRQRKVILGDFVSLPMFGESLICSFEHLFLGESPGLAAESIKHARILIRFTQNVSDRSNLALQILRYIFHCSVVRIYHSEVLRFMETLFTMKYQQFLDISCFEMV